MSVYAIVWAYEQDVANSGAKFTLVTAAQYANEDGVCWVGQQTLAEDMSMGVSTVRRHLDHLESELEIIERIERRRKDGTRSTDFIKLLGFKRKRSNRAVEDTSTAQIEQNNRSNRAGRNVSKETSVSPTGQAAPAHEQKAWEELDTGQQQSRLVSYWHQRMVERDQDAPTPQQKKRFSGEVRTHINRGTPKADLYFAIDHMVSAARRGVTLELYRALADVEQQNNRHLRAVPDNEPGDVRKWKSATSGGPA